MIERPSLNAYERMTQKLGLGISVKAESITVQLVRFCLFVCCSILVGLLQSIGSFALKILQNRVYTVNI